jgi:7-carboxy-7-deazaguanine synthase
MTAYAVKELFLTLQGEGAHSGRAAVFCRFAGCNLWTGREADRAGAACRFCDTDFVGTDGEGGGRFATPNELAAAISALWRNGASDPKVGAGFGIDPMLNQSASDPKVGTGFEINPMLNQSEINRYVVLTGGEPLLQVDEPLLDALHAAGFTCAVETNGTIAAPKGLDWICVSPKAGTELALKKGNELKLVFPQAGVDPADLLGLDFEHFFLQPMDGPNVAAYTQAAVAYCLAHPRWRLSLQTHKFIGLP